MKATCKHKIKYILGTSAEKLFPAITQQIDKGVINGRNVTLKNLIVYARLARARRSNDESSISAAHFDYWKNDSSNEFYNRYTFRFDEWFLKHHAHLIDAVQAATNNNPRYQRLIEIGCGDGRVAEYCLEKIPQLQQVIGLDINQNIIHKNQNHYAAKPKLQFIHGDATQWLQNNAQPGTILLSYGGVLEYFSQTALTELMATLAASAPTLFALVEPLAPEHNLAEQHTSFTFGNEKSFSHHHRALLENAQYRIILQEELHLGGIRWMLMLAERD